MIPSHKNKTMTTKSDVYSTKQAIAVLCDLKAQKVYNEKEPNVLVKSFLLKQLNISDEMKKNSAPSLVELYEIVEASKIIGIKNYKNLYME
ncbi:hypothetical protein [Paenibacillus polymyxa]|uniref:hypothetical protein n=1 Tax=Paenibacillus polymyxa TaxID=1406 RepID=UPI001376A3EA|nr:hypothetical protein [Paenibacillus polymyxa]